MKGVSTILILEKSSLWRSPHLTTMQEALTTVLVSALLIAAFFFNILTAEGLHDLSAMQKVDHWHHSVNTNLSGTLNGTFNTVFATSDNNDCYTYSNMLKKKLEGSLSKQCWRKLNFTKLGWIGWQSNKQRSLHTQKQSLQSHHSNGNVCMTEQYQNTRHAFVHLVVCRVGDCISGRLSCLLWMDVS